MLKNSSKIIDKVNNTLIIMGTVLIIRALIKNSTEG